MTSLLKSRRSVRQLAGLAAAVVIVSAAGACASANGAGSAPASSTTRVSAAPTTQRKTNPHYDSGNTVTITATGFRPEELVALVRVPLTFVNNTRHVEQVQFEHSRGPDGQLLRSTPIQPGGRWSYTPQTWESATYHSIEQPAMRGRIQIQPPAEP